MRFTVILEREEDGGFVAIVPALPGCVSQGDSREHALENVREAIEVYIEDCRESGEVIGPGGDGVRAQAMRPNGQLLDDFHFVKGARILHVVNAPSPAATASLAIGERIVAELGG